MRDRHERFGGRPYSGRSAPFGGADQTSNNDHETPP